MRMKEESEKTGLKLNIQEQDGGAVGGHGVHLSPWIHHKLETRLPGEITITSDMQMTPP